MTMREPLFPLIADDDILVGKNPEMNLYDESDLISNIKGTYEDKHIWGSQEEGTAPRLDQEELWPPLFGREAPSYSRRNRVYQQTVPTNTPVRPEVKTQGQLAREQAREDLKKKRAASYLHDQHPVPTHVAKPVTPVPTPPHVEKKESGLHHLADKLRQEQYIIAELPAVYSLEQKDRLQEKAPKMTRNSYDFLKKSQVYNYPDRKIARERQMAQELNLTHMEED